MSSDTAVLVTSLILNNKMTLGQIPLIHDPEFINSSDINHSVQLEGFVYVSDELDINSMQIITKENSQPIMDNKIKEEFLFQDFEVDFK